MAIIYFIIESLFKLQFRIFNGENNRSQKIWLPDEIMKNAM